MAFGYGPRPKPGNNFELYAWYFMRISGVLLVFLALGHMAIMHVVNSVDDIDYDFVADRWANIGWRLYDMLLLFLAVLHGANGARVVIDDHVRRPRWRVAALSVLYTSVFVLLVMGSMIIIVFEPIGMKS